MTLQERLEHTRALCERALSRSPLAEVNTVIAARGLTSAACSGMLRTSCAGRRVAQELVELHAAVRAQVTGPDYAFERAILVQSALSALASVPELPVDESVKHWFCRDFAFLAEPPAVALPDFSLQGHRFLALGALTALTRFPAGQYHWTVTGFPLRWLLKMSWRDLPIVCSVLNRERSHLFEPHLNLTTVRTSIVTPREYFKSFYRMVASMERQPEIKGILASSWLYSRETHRVSPHLAFYNDPYREVGGVYAEVGTADPNSGFLEKDAKRAELYRSGAYKPTVGLVLCTRRQAIEWKQSHPELSSSLQLG
jgi:hypothetical protein